MLDDPADHVELPLQLGRVGDGRPHADEHLADVRTHRPCILANHGAVQGHITPAQDLQIFSLDDAGNQVPALGLGPRGQKHHPNAVLAGGRQVDSQSDGFALEQPIRSLDQHAGAVAGRWVAPGSAPVAEVNQHLHAFVDDLMCLLALYIGNEAHAASIMFLLRRVEPLLGQFS